MRWSRRGVRGQVYTVGGASTKSEGRTRRQPPASPSLRRLTVPPAVPELQQSLLDEHSQHHAFLVPDTVGSTVGEDQAGMAREGAGRGGGDTAQNGAPAHAVTSPAAGGLSVNAGGVDREESGGEEAWMEWGWWGREVVAQLCGAAV